MAANKPAQKDRPREARRRMRAMARPGSAAILKSRLKYQHIQASCPLALLPLRNDRLPDKPSRPDGIAACPRTARLMVGGQAGQPRRRALAAPQLNDCSAPMPGGLA